MAEEQETNLYTAKSMVADVETWCPEYSTKEKSSRRMKDAK